MSSARRTSPVRRRGVALALSALAVFAAGAVNAAEPRRTGGSGAAAGTSGDWVAHVDPFIGTDGHGHTYPGATAPFGMVQLSPDTGVRGWDWCSGYHSSDESILGFSHTHLSGTGIADYGDILFVPTVGDVKLKPGSKKHPERGYRSRFRHDTEVASPGYYAVLLHESGIDVELTASERVGFHRY